MVFCIVTLYKGGCFPVENYKSLFMSILVIQSFNFAYPNLMNMCVLEVYNTSIIVKINKNLTSKT